MVPVFRICVIRKGQVLIVPCMTRNSSQSPSPLAGKTVRNLPLSYYILISGHKNLLYLTLDFQFAPSSEQAFIREWGAAHKDHLSCFDRRTPPSLSTNLTENDPLKETLNAVTLHPIKHYVRCRRRPAGLSATSYKTNLKSKRSDHWE